MERNGVSYLPNDSSTERLSGMTEKSSTGAPSGQGDAPGDAPPANQEGADDKDEKKELDGTGAGSQMGGTTGGEGTTGATSTGGNEVTRVTRYCASYSHSSHWHASQPQ